ncbi:TylF/MycF/NovP-related O-methyltransferase [Nocardioides alcanivorans]|uniref:TylF/MycF/NovP-related O-methyltransferase n=1 Tax=Nocardioides alcanivorans TaxID=2897352 RepID=UPI001F15BF6F|nr:TylF/MycF/NovP-related O-methyltransferase [Nocardioides alcanivorans]
MILRKGTPETADASTTAPDLRPRLKKLRNKVRKQEEQLATLRGSIANLRGTVDKQARELALLRAASLDIFPDIPVSADVRDLVAAVREEGLTFLEEMHLLALVSCVLEMEQAGREGMVIEAGTARGGSAIVMAAAKAAGRPMYVYDVFDTIPPPTDADSDDAQERYRTIAEGRAMARGGETYYGYRDNLLGEVADSFARHGVAVEGHNVSLVQGLFEDTINIDGPVALAHVDGDWYASTMTCLERIWPHLVPGGRIMIDDYHMWSGCRTAVDEFVATHSDVQLEMRAKVHLVRS